MRQNVSYTIREFKHHLVCVPKKILYGKLRAEEEVMLRELCEYKKVEVIEDKSCNESFFMIRCA
jgi:hypothetical protein